MSRDVKGLERKGMGSFMARWRGPLWGSALLLSGALLLAGCPKKPEVQTGGPGAAGGPGVARPGAPAEAPPKAGRDVFFDFDKSILRPDAKATLDKNIEWMQANSDIRVVVEGHCDERGTNEYNLALGERRANAVKDYLVAGGIASNRIETISYGEERPFVLGHDESAWKWNRRGHFVEK